MTFYMHMGETHGKKIVSMVDDIDGDPIMVCFCDCKSCTSTKIMQNPSNKPMPEVTTKLGRVYMDFWGLSPNISLERDQYTWTATNQVIGQVWIEFRPNKSRLLQFIWDWKKRLKPRLDVSLNPSREI